MCLVLPAGGHRACHVRCRRFHLKCTAQHSCGLGTDEFTVSAHTKLVWNPHSHCGTLRCSWSAALNLNLR
jgi:hypothetical protein